MDFLASVYKDDLLPDFNARFSFGGNSWSQSNYGMQGDRRSQPVAYPDQFSFANISDTRQLGLTESFYDKKINSLYGFLNLSYKDYLFLELTGRNDWSSTLPVETNSYFYPSANVSFVATEAFDLDSLDWLSFAKLRVAFASTAVDTSPYRTASVFGTGSFAGNLTVSLPGEVPPVGLKPQISDSYEIGTTLGFMDNRLNLDLTYYYSNSYNQILSSPIPNSSGSGKYVFNTGELENYGFEVQLNANVINKSDLSWDILLNYSNNKNYVVALDDTAEFLELANQWGVYGPSVKVKPGEQYGAIYGYDYERNTNGEKLVSDDGHHYLTTSEKVILGNATPDFIFGLNNTLRYKNFSLGVNIDGKVGGDVFAGSYAAGMYLGHSPNTVKERNGGGLPYNASDGVTYNTGVILEGVHADGTTNTTVVNPIWKYMGNFGSAWGDRTALVNGVMQKEYFLHTETVLDNSWVKLRQVSLSYSLPQELLKKTNIFQRLSLSVVGRDLLYLYQNMPDNINPEGLVNVGNGQGVEWGSMPGFSSFTIGIQASF
jgi:iron complex outermembrane receptor protein